jgi:hypothetical protein
LEAGARSLAMCRDCCHSGPCAFIRRALSLRASLRYPTVHDSLGCLAPRPRASSDHSRAVVNEQDLAHLAVIRAQKLAGLRVDLMRLHAREALHLDVS